MRISIWKPGLGLWKRHEITETQTSFFGWFVGFGDGRRVNHSEEEAVHVHYHQIFGLILTLGSGLTISELIE